MNNFEKNSLPRVIIIILLLLVFRLPFFGQSEDHFVLPGFIVGNDTILTMQLDEVIIYGWKPFVFQEIKENTRLVRNVKKVYPYAKLAGIKLKEYEEILAQAPTDKARRKIMKQVEGEIETEYGQDLRDMTFSQGKILLKLVYRETGNTSYDLVSDLRGEFAAVFYQAFARIFGYNLKVTYDPEGDDRDIESIVRMIEAGRI